MSLILSNFIAATLQHASFHPTRFFIDYRILCGCTMWTDASSRSTQCNNNKKAGIRVWVAGLTAELYAGRDCWMLSEGESGREFRREATRIHRKERVGRERTRVFMEECVCSVVERWGRQIATYQVMKRGERGTKRLQNRQCHIGLSTSTHTDFGETQAASGSGCQ